MRVSPRFHRMLNSKAVELGIPAAQIVEAGVFELFTKTDAEILALVGQVR